MFDPNSGISLSIFGSVRSSRGPRALNLHPSGSSLSQVFLRGLSWGTLSFQTEPKILRFVTELAMFCRVSGELNGESILGEDLNCYVVTEDGR